MTNAAFIGMARWGQGLYPGIEICPNLETWEAWREVQLADRIHAALAPIALQHHAAIKAIKTLPDPEQAIMDYLQLVAPEHQPWTFRPHDPACALRQVQVIAERQLYFSRWPLACRVCNGWGGVASRGAFLSSPPEFDPCSRCAEADDCARCGESLQDQEACPSCGWTGHGNEDGTADVFDGCACGEETQP